MKTSNPINHTRNALKQFALGVAASAVVVLGSGLTAKADYSNTVRAFSPPAYRRLNEATPVPTDMATNLSSLGTALNGSYVGAAVHPVPGALVGSADTAVSIPGGGRITIPWNAAMNPPGAFTVECWANADGAGGSHTLIQSMIQGQNPANANDRSGWNLREVGTDLQFVVGTTSGAPFTTTTQRSGPSSPASANTWSSSMTEPRRASLWMGSKPRSR